MDISKITQEDMEFIYSSLSESEKQKFVGANILITGFAGSLGYSLLHFLFRYHDQLQLGTVYGVDNFMFGEPKWVQRISQHPNFILKKADIISCDLAFAKEATLIFHMASLASPVYYRLHPIETIDADVIGLRRLLDFYQNKSIKGFLFYSSSEIYGDPHKDYIPTPESYWGNVNVCGPRSCYDESKRFGETLCYYYAKQYGMPVVIVRPFNNYGPGMRINDQRVVADFAKAVLDHEDIIIYSDGTPTRTFDYIPDATVGYIKCILHGAFNIFNIGSDKPEISIAAVAELYQKIANELLGYKGNIVYQIHQDKEYLIDNPNRRCPDITKARSVLGYEPKVHIEEGVKRYLQYLVGAAREEFEW